MDRRGQKAFKKPKSYLGKPHLLTQPKEGEEFKLYLTISRYVVSAILVIEVE